MEVKAEEIEKIFERARVTEKKNEMLMQIISFLMAGDGKTEILFRASDEFPKIAGTELEIEIGDGMAILRLTRSGEGDAQ